MLFGILLKSFSTITFRIIKMPRKYSFKDSKTLSTTDLTGSHASLDVWNSSQLRLEQHPENNPAYINNTGQSSSKIAPTTMSSANLQRHVGLFGALALIVGSMIGSGIFASGSAVALRAGSSGMVLCVWAGCGMLATMGALCYAELGTAVPVSGSEHAYLSYAFGGIGGFMYSWTAVLVLKPSAQAGICLTFGAYVVESFGSSLGCSVDKAGLQKLFAGFAIGKERKQKYFAFYI